ncbi:MAG: hypothetical protein JWN60_32 [Acidobacteria bacterium]|jgi:hypothetical protein|nr:hypothetical protein [Acidobacteriota bacterium]
MRESSIKVGWKTVKNRVTNKFAAGSKQQKEVEYSVLKLFSARKIYNCN